MSKKYQRPLAQNRKASHEYFIEETYEAGIVLQGTEIKSIRAGRVNITDAHIRVMNGEAQIINMHIAPYEQGNRHNHDPTRTRKLLLHRSEIDKLIGLTQRQGYTLVPLKIYIKNGFAKDRKSTRLNSSHVAISYAVFCLKKKRTSKKE